MCRTCGRYMEPPRVLALIAVSIFSRRLQARQPQKPKRRTLASTATTTYATSKETLREFESTQSIAPPPHFPFALHVYGCIKPWSLGGVEYPSMHCGVHLFSAATPYRPSRSQGAA